LVLVLLTWSGCLSPISKSVREELNPELSLKQILEAPEDYIGETVLLGGEILYTRNTTQGTLVCVLQKELSRRDKPHEGDRSDGRFLVQVARFLDPEIYSSRRLLTVAGRVMGTQVRKIDDLEYTHPVIHAEEIHLWGDEPERREYYFYPHPVWYFWGVSDSTFPPWY
jgi:outer membrane lipoprotein